MADIALRNITKRFKSVTAVEGLSLDIADGEFVVLLGPTGAGKTTLLALLTRFYDPTAGDILLDGVNLRDIRLRDLRSQFAIVHQEPVLFSTKSSPA